MRSMYVFISIVMLYSTSVKAQYTNCTQFNVTNNSSTRLPQLAMSFVTTIECKILNKNRSINLNEYFNYNARKYAIETENIKQIVDYDLKEKRLINTTNGINKCIKVSKLPERNHPGIVFGEHIPSTSDILHFGKKYGEKYMGQATVRNIRCIRWQSCLVTNHSNYMIDYYFKEDARNIPVRCEVRGFHVRNETKRNVHNVYDFFNFRIGSPPGHVFRSPPGTYCKNVVKQASMPELPDHFSYSLEFHTIKKSNLEVSNSKIYYDFRNGIFRYDHTVQSEGQWRQVKEIHIKKQSAKFMIYSPFECNITPLSSNENVETKEYIDNHINMKRAVNHVKTQGAEYSYEGTDVVRNMNADVWIYIRNVTSKSHFNRIEWYFLKEDPAKGQPKQAAVPLKVIGYYGNEANVQFTVHIFKFNTEWNTESITNPIRHCLELSSSLHVITFFISGLPKDRSDAITKPQDLVGDLLLLFAKTANVTADRLAIELVVASQIDVRLSILGWPLKNVARPKNFNPAVDVAAKIEDFIVKEDVSVTFSNKETSKNYTGKFTKTYFDGKSMKYFSGDKVPQKCKSFKRERTGWGMGVMVSFLTGFFVMFLGLHLILRRNGHSLKRLMKEYGKFGKDNEGNATVTEMSDKTSASSPTDVDNES